MSDGFDMSELTKFERKLINTVNDTMPKESRKFIKKEANKLNKQNKKVYQGKGIGEITGNFKKGFKSGKAYKYKGAWSARAYNNSPHAHLLNDGYMWTPNKGQSGEERFIPGFHFMEESARLFEEGYYTDVEQFLKDLLIKGL